MVVSCDCKGSCDWSPCPHEGQDTGLEVPNLDAMDQGELEEHSKVFKILNEYCDIKWVAVNHRKAGRIQAALDQEDYCEKLYNKLPNWARW